MIDVYECVYPDEASMLVDVFSIGCGRLFNLPLQKKKKVKKIAHFHVCCLFAATSFSQSSFYSLTDKLGGFMLKFAQCLQALCNESLIQDTFYNANFRIIINVSILQCLLCSIESGHGQYVGMLGDRS